jgi:hypothetical protein
LYKKRELFERFQINPHGISLIIKNGGFLVNMAMNIAGWQTLP